MNTASLDTVRRLFYPVYLDLILEQMGRGVFWMPHRRIKVNEKKKKVFLEYLVRMCEMEILLIDEKRSFSDMISDCFDTGMRPDSLYDRILEYFDNK